MEKVLIFAGTKEGRLLAEHMCRLQKEVHISVATEYGEEVLPEETELVVHQGRLTERQMEDLLMQEDWETVIDATHPYAVEVSANLKQACRQTGRPYLRLLREEQTEQAGNGVLYVESKEEAAAYLNREEGNILLTTGSKELQDYVNLISDTGRIFARILPDGEMVEQCRKMGLKGNQIICMQGPFRAELNEAMLKQVQARFLVTKDTGETGGFPQKLAGAKKSGATVVVIRRPRETSGYSMEELLKMLGLPQMGEPQVGEPQMELSQVGEPQMELSQIGEPQMELSQMGEPRIEEAEAGQRTVTLVGIGMGNMESMTLEAYRACQQADIILGAERMLEALRHFEKPVAAVYQPAAVIEFLQTHPRYHRVVAAFSGDVGFYSGAGKLLEALEQENIRTELVCGISSAVYAAARLHIPWQDMKLVSVHGRDQNLVGALRTHKKVFALAGKKESIQDLARELLEYGMESVSMHVGCQLSYPEEALFAGTPKDFLSYDGEGLSVAILENPEAEHTVITHGLPDGSFQRGEAPMTKEEIRSISISKLALTKHAVVYDIGAGTGSIGIECALQIPEGRVYAVEKKKEALELLAINKKKLGAANLEIISGTAPEALQGLPCPTHAFIGGSSGNMNEILEMLLQKNPKIRIVINAIALETVAEVTRIMQMHKFEFEDVVQVSVGKAKVLGHYHMMTGQNPVYIFTLQNQ